jgi:hypothetical protein
MPRSTKDSQLLGDLFRREGCQLGIQLHAEDGHAVQGAPDGPHHQGGVQRAIASSAQLRRQHAAHFLQKRPRDLIQEGPAHGFVGADLLIQGLHERQLRAHRDQALPEELLQPALRLHGRQRLQVALNRLDGQGLKHRQQEMPFGREVAEQRALRHPGLPGDLPGGRSPKPMPGEDPGRRLQDLRPPDLRSLPWPHRCLHGVSAHSL